MQASELGPWGEELADARLANRVVDRLYMAAIGCCGRFEVPCWRCRVYRDGAAEIARLTRELEEARERERAMREALEEIREVPRDDTGPEVAHFAVRRIVDRALTTPPEEASSPC